MSCKPVIHCGIVGSCPSLPRRGPTGRKRSGPAADLLRGRYRPQERLQRPGTTPQSPPARRTLLRPGRTVPEPSLPLRAQPRRQDGLRQEHRADLAEQPGHRRRRRLDAPRQAELDPGPGPSRRAQRRPLRRLRRLAPADDQGTLFADRFPRHGSQRILGHRYLRLDPLHRHQVLQVRLRAEHAASGSSTRSTHRAPCTSTRVGGATANSSASTSPTAGSKATT